MNHHGAIPAADFAKLREACLPLGPSPDPWIFSQRKFFITMMHLARCGQGELANMCITDFEKGVDESGVPIVYFDLTAGRTKNYIGAVNMAAPLPRIKVYQDLEHPDSAFTIFWKRDVSSGKGLHLKLGRSPSLSGFCKPLRAKNTSLINQWG